MDDNQKQKDEAKRLEDNQILVVPINMEKLNAYLDAAIKESLLKKEKPADEDEYFEVYGKLGVIQGTTIFLDAEAVGGDDLEIQVQVFKGTRANEAKGTRGSNGMFPSYEPTFRTAELVLEFGDAPVPLPEFMGSRYNYNSRIRSNQSEVRGAYNNKLKTV
jgi:hypothetical protein